MAIILAERVGIAPHEMVWFRMGAFLHDLGKIVRSVDFPWDIRPMVAPRAVGRRRLPGPAGGGGVDRDGLIPPASPIG